MAQETLKLVITADNADALAKIKQFSESLGAQTRQFEQNKKATGDATNSLVNFSRLAEDSAYGLRGAANNINPFIESFKRLKDETGSTKTALMSMAQGLLGPAGILVAVSTISTVLISYADSQRKAKKEAEDLAKADNDDANALKKKKEALDAIYDSTAKEAVQVETLISLLNNETESRKRKENAIKELQKINPDVFKNLKLEGTEVKNLNDYYDSYITNLKNVILLKTYQNDLEKIIKEELKNGPALKPVDPKPIKDANTLLEQNKVIIQATENANNKLDVSSQNVLKSIEKQNQRQNEKKDLLEKISKISPATKLGGGGGGKEEEDPFVTATKEFENATKANLEIRKKDLISQQTYLDNYEKILQSYLNKIKNIDTKEAQKTLLKLTPKELIKSVSDTYDADLEAKAAGMDVFNLGKDLSKGANIQGNEPSPFSKEAFENGRKEMDKFFKDAKKNFDDADKQAKAFAQTLANTTTNAIRGMWESIKSGENILESLGNAFLNLAEDITFAILRMEILAALEKALDIGGAAATGGATAAGGGFFKLLAKVFGGGMAEGGIVTGPTLTMVGEGNEHEAVMPLSKLSGFLNTSFNAGAMTKGGTNGGQFVLKGSDLVLALQRSNTNLNIRRGI